MQVIFAQEAAFWIWLRLIPRSPLYVRIQKRLASPHYFHLSVHNHINAKYWYHCHVGESLTAYEIGQELGGN